MPPKKRGPKKNKGKKGDDEEEKVKELGKILENEIKTIQQRIGRIIVIVVLEESKANRSDENIEKYRRLELEIKDELDKEKGETEKITYSMGEKIKRMEETMIKRLKVQEEAVTKYTQELKDKNQAIEDLQKNMEDTKRTKDDEIRRLENHMEMMSSEFMTMLKV